MLRLRTVRSDCPILVPSPPARGRMDKVTAGAGSIGSTMSNGEDPKLRLTPDRKPVTVTPKAGRNGSIGRS